VFVPHAKHEPNMRNIISLAHSSLDGFMAHVYPLISAVDAAVYGRITYKMSEGYWPRR